MPRACPACGYDLANLRDPMCPECGAGFNPQLHPNAANSPAWPTIRRVYCATLAAPIITIVCALLHGGLEGASRGITGGAAVLFRYIAGTGVVMLIPCGILCLTLGVGLASRHREPKWWVLPVLFYSGAAVLLWLDPFGLTHGVLPTAP